MSYQIADLVNGPFSQEVETLADAQKLLALCVEEGKQANREASEDGSEVGSDGTPVESFFFIVDAETGEEI